MPAAAPAATPRPGASRYSPAQQRIIAAALDLFADHGVHGTSLQMIADALGVTKAAVYHRFRTKEEIVVAAVDVELARLGDALAAAETARPGPEAVGTLLAQVIDLAVRRRRMVGTLQHDPVIVRLLAEHEPFQQFTGRLFRALLGGERGPSARIAVAMAAAAIGGAVTHPLVADLDDATLGAELLERCRRLLDLDL